MAYSIITQEELAKQMRHSAEQMLSEDPNESYQGLAALQALLTRHELQHDLVSLSADLADDTLTVVWILRQFVNNGLWRNFGAGTTGFPESEGGHLIYQISHGLGRFILRFFEDEGMVPFEILTLVIGQYFQLLRVTEGAHTSPNSDPRVGWVIL